MRQTLPRAEPPAPATHPRLFDLGVFDWAMRIRMIPAVLLLVLASLVAFATPAATAATAHATNASHAVPKGYYDWTTYHGNVARTGLDPDFKTFTFGHSTLRVTSKIRLDGAVYASPIVAKNITIVVTENDSVYAFGLGMKLLWKRHLGTPSPANQRPCGNIDPLGITGTPIYDASTEMIYVAAELSGNPPTHTLYGIRIGDGHVNFARGLDLAGVDRAAMQERGALTVAAGRVWVPFGGLAGDCGAYKGRVIGYSLKGTGAPVSYTVPTGREAGIWTPPGPTVDSTGHLYVAVGNGESGVGDAYDHSDSVLELNGNAKLVDSFSPATWPSDNDADLDLGSQGPALVDNKWVFADGKRGTAYVLRKGNLGKVGGQVSQLDVCKSFGGTAVYGSTVYVPCTDGIRAVQISSAGKMTVRWHADSSVTGSPVLGGGVVWSLDTGAGVLHVVGRAGGFTRATVAVGSVTRFATPALSGDRVLIGTTTGLTVVRF